MSWLDKRVNFSELIGKTFVGFRQVNDDELYFTDSDGLEYRMYHDQDCCEHVYIEDICGDLNDLIGSPITMAEESFKEGEKKDDWDDSSTWTFYRFATNKGYITIRWYGSSNGYYGESAEFIILKDSNKESEMGGPDDWNYFSMAD